MNKTAVIIGVSGQDGRLLFNFLSKKNFRVLGIDKNIIKSNNINWKNKIDITKPDQVFDLIKKIKPNDVYHLAAFHHSSQDHQVENLQAIYKSYQINVFSLLNFLEGIRIFSPKSRLFYAASSLIFGKIKAVKQNENTPFQPDSIYGINKLDGLFLCRMYRNIHNIFVSVGILYNHESAYRTENFVSRKIIQGAINIKNKKQNKLFLGDLHASADWGYAPDYVEAMYKILKAKYPDDFIIATGKRHCVIDFIKICFEYFGMDWHKYVKVDKGIITRKSHALLGDATKLKKITGWKQKTSFQKMVELIIEQLDG